MKKIFLATILVLLLSVETLAQGIVIGDYPLSKNWDFDINTIQFSFLQMREGTQKGSASVEPLVAVGSSLTFSYVNKGVAPEYDAVVAINIPTVFIKTDDNGKISVMPAALVGLLDNRACFGVGYDLSDQANAELSRWAFLFSFGFHFGD